MNRIIPRSEVERFTAALAEKRRRMAKAEHSTRGYRDENGVWQGGLLSFVRYFWHVLEPGTPFTEGWILEAIVEHLESVTFGEVTNLLINVPPGCCKSLLTNVYWPAWEWSAMGLSHVRYVTFSYSASNTERDNQRFGDLITSSDFVAMYPEVKVRQNGMTMVSNLKHGWKLASSVTGSATGKRGNRAICFPADQLVHTENGPIAIGDIVEGRLRIRVPSYNTVTRQASLRPITGWHKNPSSDLVKIILSDGSSVRCTPDHRFWDGVKWVEASRLRVGTALPVVRQADTLSYIAPSSANADALNGHPFDAVFSCNYVGAIRRVAGYFSNLFFGENCHTPRGQERAVADRIINVLLSCSVFQVSRPWVQRVSIFVADLLAFWAMTDKCLRYQFVDEPINSFPTNSQGDPGVIVDESASHYLAWDAKVPSALLMANSVRIDGHSGFPDNDARHAPHSSHVRYLIEPFQPDDAAPFLHVVSVIKDGHVDASYCLTVETNHTFIVGGGKGLIASNCDDLNNVKESESKQVMEETNRWFRESLSSRLNNMEVDAKIVIAQRVGESDVSGEILRLGLPYCHLMIQMEYEWQADENGEPYTTQIGWVDPRWRPKQEDCEGELAWPERFSEKSVQSLKTELGPYATAAQLQQSPEARGGGIIKREWWLPAEPVMLGDGQRFPPFSYVIASLDGAFDEKEENDFSALTVWGVFQNEHGNNRAMLVHGWAKKLQISGIKVEIEPGEHESVYRRRAMPHWGLVEWTADTCNRFKVDRLLIENKASGKPAAQSLQNSHGRQGWAIVLVEPKGDKYARGLAVQPSFSQGMVYAPDREWATDVIDECAIFPRGRHDDRYDSTTQAIKHLRDSGLLRSDEDRRAEDVDAIKADMAKFKRKPLYPGMRASR